jgi:uncharacterized protein YceK
MLHAFILMNAHVAVCDLIFLLIMAMNAFFAGCKGVHSKRKQGNSYYQEGHSFQKDDAKQEACCCSSCQEDYFEEEQKACCGRKEGETQNYKSSEEDFCTKSKACDISFQGDQGKCREEEFTLSSPKCGN